MKRMIFTALLAIIFASMASPESRFYQKQKQMVDNQHRGDLKNRDAILRELRGFLDENSAASGGKVKLGAPVKEDSVTSVSSTESHYSGVIPPKIYGYANTDNLNMRAEDRADARAIGKLSFKEQVEIINQSEDTDEIKGMKAPWLLIKRGNGDEGWVFGAYISDDMPTEPGRESGKTDWNLIMPAKGRISSRFGERIDPVSKRRHSFHRGIDIAAPEGTPVYAAEKGRVFEAGYNNGGYGNLIILKHSGDMATYYGHLSTIIIKKGDDVSKGTLIGKVGSTGKSTGNHLHFEVRKGNQSLDPENYVR